MVIAGHVGMMMCCLCLEEFLRHLLGGQVFVEGIVRLGGSSARLAQDRGDVLYGHTHER